MKRELHQGTVHSYKVPTVSATLISIEKGFAVSESYNNTIPDLEEDNLGSY